MELSAGDNIRCRAAQGWVELGNAAEAEREFNTLSPEARLHPEARKTWWRILALAGRWAEALRVAVEFTDAHPEQVEAWVQKAYALHELRRTAEARDQLLTVVERFPEDPILRYNLGCYECQLGHADAGEKWLKRACRVGDPAQLKAMALKDPDYQPIWDRIRAMA